LTFIVLPSLFCIYYTFRGEQCQPKKVTLAAQIALT